MIQKINWKYSVSKPEMVKLITENMDVFKHSGGSAETFIMKAKICHSTRVFTLPDDSKFTLNFQDLKNAIDSMRENIPKEDTEYIKMYS
jgi:hypothetical protein